MATMERLKADENLFKAFNTLQATYSWKPTILQGAESMQNVMQDHKILHLAEFLILK